MANLILDERDQRFVLREMLEVESLCTYEKYADYSGDVFDMVLTEAGKFAQEEVFPTLTEGDRQGCRLEDGQVYVPGCFHRAYRLFCEGGWNAMDTPVEFGGQGLPVTIANAATEWFIHNFAFLAYPGLGKGASHLIAHYGTAAQKERYLEKLVSGQWCGTMGLTEPGAGSDVGNLSTKAIRQADGTFRIQGTKIFHTGADHDLTENIIQPVLARIEGDPAGTKGISIFLVPKYLVNDDGSLGRRNDYEIANVEEKMGIHASATCLVNYGDNGQCYAELLGEEREGMKVMFLMMNEMRLGVGVQGLGSASMAYLHALNYARERLQGSALIDFKNPAAPRVPIMEHPDVRRMLLWMKSQVEGMRAMIYYTGFCLDRSECCKSAEERDKWLGLAEVLTPICKAYCSDMGFRVTEYAIQVYGGYGYCAEYPVEQLMRDEKIASVYEGANGIQALDLVARKLGMKKGAYFMNLLGEMNAVVNRFQAVEETADLAEAVGKAVNTLAEAAMYFARCGKEGKFLVPINNAYPFLMMMGSIMSAWFLLWGAGIASERLAALRTARGVTRDDPEVWAAFLKDSAEAAFYEGKIHAARYFIRNELPVSLATMTAIESEDMSILAIANESF